MAGEIIPQAVCSRHGLAVGAYSAWFVRILMWTFAIIAYPISKVLDWLLGQGHTVLPLCSHANNALLNALPHAQLLLMWRIFL